MSRPVVVDWIYLRMMMRRRRGDDSYRGFSNRFPALSQSTCHRFLSQGSELDLKSLLCVIEVLDLEVEKVFIRPNKQPDLLSR